MLCLRMDSKIKIINVAESEREVENLLRKHAGTLFAPRIKMLIQIKKYSGEITLDSLHGILKVSENTLSTWRTSYLSGGIIELLSHKKTGHRPSVFSPEEHAFIEKTLINSSSNIAGYKELLLIVNKKYS